MTKQRRTFSQEFKQEAVALVVEHGYSYAAAVRSLGVNGALIGRCSMGRRANCYDNVAMESFFSHAESRAHSPAKVRHSTHR